MKKSTILIVLAIVFGLFVSTGVDASNIRTGYGWSVSDDENTAVKEAVKMLKNGVNSPALVILYTTVGYDVPRVHRLLREEIGDTAKIFGLTSCWGVVTRDGVHVGEKGSLAVLGVSSPASSFGVSGSQVETPEEVRRKAGESLHEAVLNAGKSKGARPDMVLMAASPGIEEEVLKGIADAAGKEVPVYGGSAADNTLAGEWKVFSNNAAYSSGFSLVAIFTELKVGHAYHSGYLGSQKNGVATLVKDGEGRILKEIDGRPAAEVYNEWAYGKFERQLAEGGNILGPASFYPIARRVKKQGRSHYIGIHPSGINLKDKSLQVFADIKEGTRLFFTEGTPDALIYRPRTITRRALVNGRIKKKDAAMGLLIYCGGTMLAVKDRIKEIVPIVNSTIGKAPYIGAFTFGEQGNIKGYGNFHGNLMSSMVIIGAEKQR